jgi:histidyl-tRNA synthetase
MTKQTFQSAKGTKDVLPVEQPYWQYIESVIKNVVQLYGYEKLDLPLFEETALFQRGVGEGTDIVEKEMYTFLDKGGASITLRPEFTAGVVRSYLQNGMANLPKPVKVWSIGPVFRYERPQAGRFRQHTQFNVEALGEQDPALDFEIMSVAWHLYKELGFKDLSFQINSIGCPRCRPDYLDQLVNYYRKHSNEICEDCKKRLVKNPLRVLDCKNPKCLPIINGAPLVVGSLCKECEEHFQTLKRYLDDQKRPYQINNRLVRGLDYYTKTVFEVLAQGIGAQNAVCGGGRYDVLAEVLGGAPTPGVGFASGLERIVLTLQQENIFIPEINVTDVYISFQGAGTERRAVELLSMLRNNKVKGIMAFGSRSLKAQLREANRRGVEYTVIIGETELARDEVTIKKMDGGEQDSVSCKNLVSYFKEKGLGE